MSRTRSRNIPHPSRTEDVRHEKANFHRREEFACALSLTLAEFPQKILVAVAEKIWLHVLQAEPVARVREFFQLRPSKCRRGFLARHYESR